MHEDNHSKCQNITLFKIQQYDSWCSKLNKIYGMAEETGKTWESKSWDNIQAYLNEQWNPYIIPVVRKWKSGMVTAYILLFGSWMFTIIDTAD